MSVINLLPSDNARLKFSEKALVGWTTNFDDGAVWQNFGPTSLIKRTNVNNTIKGVPGIHGVSEKNNKIFIGLNNIPYTADLDDVPVSLSFFIQIFGGGTVTCILYDTVTDPEHDIEDPLLGSSFFQWAANYDHAATSESLKDYFDSEDIDGVCTVKTYASPTSTVDGSGSSITGAWEVFRTSWYETPIISAPRNLGIFIEIEFSDAIITDDHCVFFTMPAITGKYAWQLNQIGQSSRFFMPAIFRDFDDVGGTPGVPLARMIDVMTHISDVVDEFVLNWTYYDIADGFDESNQNSYSKLVDPTFAPVPYLIWMSQFVNCNASFVRPTSTAWSGLPKKWGDLADLVDTDGDGDLEWSEIELYSPGFTRLVEYFKWALTTGYVGFNAGTLKSIEETVKFFLEGDKEVTIEKHPTGAGPFSIKLYTNLSETPDATAVGGTSEIIEAAIALSKPLGIEVLYEIEAG